MLAILFLLVAGVVAALVALAFSRAADPTLQRWGGTILVAGLVAFLCLRLLGLAVFVGVTLLLWLAAGLATLAVLLDREKAAQRASTVRARLTDVWPTVSTAWARTTRRPAR